VRGRGVAWLVALLLFLVGFFGRGAWSGALFAGGTIAGNPRLAGNPNADRTPTEFTVLLLGIDNRARQITIQRTDTIMVVHVDTATGRVALMSVPRDTMVEIAGHGVEKINSVAEFAGGPSATVEAVNRLLGTNIQYWVLTNFAGFRDVIDALGCVEIDVPTVMDYTASDVHIHLNPGVQCLSGTQALDFVRWRETALGDIARTEDQQMLIKAVAHRLLSPAGLARLPLVLPVLGHAVETNLPGHDLVTLLGVARSLGTHRMPQVSETLPGYYLTYQGLSYWFVIPKDAVAAYADLLRGKKWPGAPFDAAAVQAAQSGTWSSYPLVRVTPVGGTG
jgi:LCP family protein required for cell wall assembly